MPESGENITLLMDPAATVKNLSITLLRGKRDNYITASEGRGLIIILPQRLEVYNSYNSEVRGLVIILP